MQSAQKAIDKPVRFALVGGIGFIIDGGVLSVLAALGWNIYVARAVSFPVAVLSTYYLNRRITFRTKRTTANIERRTAVGYYLIQGGGALTNVLAFSLVIHARPSLTGTPLIALAIGAIFGLFFNYFFSTVLFRWRSHYERH